MEPLQNKNNEYLKELAERKKDSRVYHEHQLIGLEVADILEDRPHKALYIRLTKKYGKGTILSLAKSVAERRDIKNKGAYFMSILHADDAEKSKKA